MDKSLKFGIGHQILKRTPPKLSADLVENKFAFDDGVITFHLAFYWVLSLAFINCCVPFATL